MSAAPPADLALPIEWLPAAGRAEQLIVLLHGWRGEAMDLAPLAQALRSAFPQAAILAPDGALPGDEKDGRARGRQWYSLVDLDFTRDGGREWHARVTAARLAFEPWLRAQQRRLGVGTAATALGGFSQGAIVSLETAVRSDGLAGRILAFAGCFTVDPPAAPRETTIHLFHGGADAVIPAASSRHALETLGALQGDATLDIAEGIGHVLHPVLVDCCLHRLKSHIPLRTWQAALGARPGRDHDEGRAATTD